MNFTKEEYKARLKKVQSFNARKRYRVIDL